MGVTPEELKVVREVEWRKCERSFPYFFANYWHVVTPDRGVRPVDARELQMSCANDLQESRRLLIVKARQIGWSTLMTAYVFWTAWFHPYKHCLVLSKREDPDAVLIVQNVKFAFGLLPAWMRARGPKTLNDRKGNITYDNGSYIDSDASSDDPARGRTLALLILDEFGKFENPYEAWQSAVPATEFGQCIVLGNPNGYGSWYHTVSLEAKQGLSDFDYRFYPWWAASHRDQTWFDRETSSMTPAQVAAEYPDNDTDCWISAGSPVFDMKVIEKWGTVEPHLQETTEGTYRTWKDPEEKATYVIGADVAGGGPKGDFSVAQVLDVATGEHVCEFRGKLDPVHYAHLLHRLALRYNRATLVVEANNVGGPVLRELLDEIKYFRLYKRRTYNYEVDKTTTKYGWETTRATKFIAIQDMWKRLTGGRVKTTDARLLEEMVAYRYINEHEMGGFPHDDRVMAMAIAIQGLVAEPGAMVSAAPPEPKPESRFAGFDGTLVGAAFQLGGDPKKAEQKMREYYEIRPVVMNRSGRRRRGL